MGTCLCKGHKELHLSMSVLQGEVEEEQPSPGQIDPPNGSMANKTCGYGIGELATSSLLGLVATIKDHITKPTAMAQGRVAHLIEWKGWGGGGVGGVGGAGGVGRGQGAELQDDELFYSQMSDEIKEARFAAGVAQQFALAEAAMDLWSMDETDRPSTSWKGTQSHYLSYYLQDGGSVGLPQHLYDIHAGDQVGFTAEPPPQAVQPPPHPPRPDPPAFTAAAQTHAEGSETVERSGTLRPLECSSLSEDDVFYN